MTQSQTISNQQYITLTWHCCLCLKCNITPNKHTFQKVQYHFYTVSVQFEFRKENVCWKRVCMFCHFCLSHLTPLSNYILLSFCLCIVCKDIDESKLIDGTEVINSTFTHNKIGCQMTFDDDYSAYWVYFINFLGTLAVLPGNIVSALLMDKIGRLSMLGKTGHTHTCSSSS